MVATALEKARTAGRFLVLDFYAEWCAPCRLLEEQVLPDPRVRAVFDRFVLVRVDTDEHPDAATYYEVAVMPTLLVLDGRGRELRRFDGAIEASALAAGLKRLTGSDDDGGGGAGEKKE